MVQQQFAILRFVQYKGPAIDPIEAHNERTKEQYASNPDIDTTRSGQNVHLIAPSGPYRETARRMASEAKCRLRKDSVLMVEALVTGSPEIFKAMRPEEREAYFRRALAFLKARQRAGTFLSAVVHMDEKTPHMHVVFVPLTQDGRLSAKEIIGNRAKLVAWQDGFYSHMCKAYPQLERGESASKTGRDHIPPAVFKQMARLTRQKAKLEALLCGVNLLNDKGRLEQIGRVLERYIPSVEKMQTQLKRYEKAFTQTVEENKALRAENAKLEKALGDTPRRLNLYRFEGEKLRRDYKEALRVLERVPREVLSAYTQGETKRAGRQGAEHGDRWGKEMIEMHGNNVIQFSQEARKRRGSMPLLPKPPIDLDNSRRNEADMSEGANDMSKSNRKFRQRAQSDRLALRGYAAGTVGSVSPVVDQGRNRRYARSGGIVSSQQGAHGPHVHREYVFSDVCSAACAQDGGKLPPVYLAEHSPLHGRHAHGRGECRHDPAVLRLDGDGRRARAQKEPERQEH